MFFVKHGVRVGDSGPKSMEIDRPEERCATTAPSGVFELFDPAHERCAR